MQDMQIPLPIPNLSHTLLLPLKLVEQQINLLLHPQHLRRRTLLHFVVAYPPPPTVRFALLLLQLCDVRECRRRELRLRRLHRCG